MEQPYQYGKIQATNQDKISTKNLCIKEIEDMEPIFLKDLKPGEVAVNKYLRVKSFYLAAKYLAILLPIEDE